MPEHIFRGNLGQAEREKHGSDNWYDWSIANWGTKWNSYGYQEGGQTDFDGSTLNFGRFTIMYAVKLVPPEVKAVTTKQC